MSERTMSNVREKLSKSREMCPGLSEEVYALTDYMAKVANDELVPQGLVMCFVLSMEDIRRGENGFAFAESKEILEYLAMHKTQVLAQAVYVPQIIDAIADEDFANEFREICKEMLHFDPPRREEKYNQSAEIEGNYTEYVKVAVNWWANAIVNPKFDNGEDMIMSNLRGRLSKSREMCPGLSEEVYALTDYMAMLADSDPLAVSEPRDTAFSLFICIENIKAGKSGSVVPDIDEFPEYFIEHKTKALAEVVHVPKVICAVTNENFANEFESEFHNICKEREKA